MQRISLTRQEFDRFRPLNGHVLVHSSQDVERTKGGLYLDNTYKPERHQRVHNTVVRIPPTRNCTIDFFKSHIEVNEGEEVIINYFPVMQALQVEVEGTIYRLIPYNWLILSLRTDLMLNDWIMVDKISEAPKSSLEVNEKKSRVFFKVTKGFSGTFIYQNKENSVLEPQPGDIVTLRTSAVLPLEDKLHLDYDNELHYVTRAYNVLSINL